MHNRFWRKKKPSDISFSYKKMVVLEWDETLVPCGDDTFHDGIVEFFTFLKNNNHQVIITSNQAKWEDIDLILSRYGLNDFITQSDIYTPNSPTLHTLLGDPFNCKGYNKVDILEAHRNLYGFGKSAYFVIENNNDSLAAIRNADYTGLKIEPTEGTPIRKFFKQAEILINPIAALETEIQAQVARLKKNGEPGRYGIGNNRKATRIQEALERIKDSGLIFTSLNKFLDAEIAGEESLRTAISHRRIGLFPPKSRTQINSKVAEFHEMITLKI